MKKRIVSVILVFLLVASALPVQGRAAAAPVRYTVLVLDASSLTSFSMDGVVIYVADTAIDYVKSAAKKFLEDVHSASGTNYLAVVTYQGDGEGAEVLSPFSTDLTALKNAVDSFSEGESHRSVAAGLHKASELLESVSEPGAIRNVVLFTTGMTSAGEYSYSGHYGEETVGSSWKRSSNSVKLYAYANAAYEEAETLKQTAQVYSIGLFQIMDGMPERAEDVVELFKLCAREWASSPELFYDVQDPDDLEFVFGKVAGDVLDTDGDGLLDDWENNGVELDGVFIDLPAMGADPNIPDIFVEVDWMLRPAEKFLWIQTSPELSLAPSANALRMVYEAFRKPRTEYPDGIRIHIDAGPDSVDYVTGRRWGELSGGNALPYQQSFPLGDQYSNWNQVAEANFTRGRAGVFKYCLFTDQMAYQGIDPSCSGIANGIPGQYFIVSNQEWVRNTGDQGIAGTFMHELGHTLGLCHGGYSDDGTPDYYARYKPNYLSIMNYFFQTSGLEGTNELTYSEYALPALDERALDESRGIDPNNVTAGTGLGSCFYQNGQSVSVTPIADETSDLRTYATGNGSAVQREEGTGIDFNRSGAIDAGTVAVDLNGPNGDSRTGQPGLLSDTTRDWEHLILDGGTVGSQIAYIAGIDAPSETMRAALTEPTFEELLEVGALGNAGSGSLELAGPYTVIAGGPNQSCVIRVYNLSQQPTTFRLSVEEGGIAPAFSRDVRVEGSVSELSYTEVTVPLVNAPPEGEQVLELSLSAPGREDVRSSFTLSVYDPTPEERQALRDAILNGELDELVPETQRMQYLYALNSGFLARLLNRIVSAVRAVLNAVVSVIRFFWNAMTAPFKLLRQQLGR